MDTDALFVVEPLVDKSLVDTDLTADNSVVLRHDAAVHVHNSFGVVVVADTAVASVVGALGAAFPLPVAAASASFALPAPLSVGTTSGRGSPPSKIPSSVYRCAGPDRQTPSDSSTSDWLRTVPLSTAERPIARGWNEPPGRNWPEAVFRSARCRPSPPVAPPAYTRSDWHRRRRSSARTI